MSIGKSPPEIDPRIGTGNWDAFKDYPIEHVLDVAARWKARVQGERKLWLCWNVSPRWCVLQQRLVKLAGWTPLLGFDPRAGAPPVEPGSILINFNEGFDFPVMWPHFPLEFAFVFIDYKLAFWHADLLVRLSVLDQLKNLYEGLENGEMAAVYDAGGRRNTFNFRRHRFWELAGCTTQAASENLYYNGTGWWRCFDRHIKCTVPEERARRRKLHYDSGVGIRYWRNKYNGRIKEIDIAMIKEGHCSEIHKPKTYKPGPNHTNAMRNLSSELDENYSIHDVAKQFGIDHLLP
jgi:hypothetical protein